MPDISAQTPSEANAALHGVNLKVGGVTLEYSGDTPEGMVFRQSPTANAQVDEGTEVAYVISKGEPSAPSTSPSPSTSASASPASTTVAATQSSSTVKAMQRELEQAD